LTLRVRTTGDEPVEEFASRSHLHHDVPDRARVVTAKIALPHEGQSSPLRVGREVVQILNHILVLPNDPHDVGLTLEAAAVRLSVEARVERAAPQPSPLRIGARLVDRFYRDDLSRFFVDCRCDDPEALRVADCSG
jgi:hypothetical protein